MWVLLAADLHKKLMHKQNICKSCKNTEATIILAIFKAQEQI